MNNPRCCGIDSVFVEISHSSKYWYCRECKKEVSSPDNSLSAQDVTRISNTPLEEVKVLSGSLTAPSYFTPPLNNESRSGCLEPGIYSYSFMKGFIFTVPILPSELVNVTNYQWVEIFEPSHLVGNSNETLRVVSGAPQSSKPRPGSEPNYYAEGLVDYLVVPENLKLKKTTVKYIDVVLKSGNRMYSHRLDVTPEMAQVLLERLPKNKDGEYQTLEQLW